MTPEDGKPGKRVGVKNTGNLGAVGEVRSKPRNSREGETQVGEFRQKKLVGDSVKGLGDV